jgi:hypothetical protein
MVKLLVFAILLASSPATGLLQALFRTESNCYSGCTNKYGNNRDHLKSCRQGCDVKLQNEDCATQCKSSTGENVDEFCQFGCSLSHADSETKIEKPNVLTDPVPTVTESVAPAAPETERPHSIILIRLRQRPLMPMQSMPMQSMPMQSMSMPSMHQFFNSDPIQMFNEMIKQFQERTKTFEESIRQSFDENGKELPKLSGFIKLSELPKSIPLIRIPIKNPDASSEEQDDKKPPMEGFRHGFHHGHGHHFQLQGQTMEPKQNHLRQFVSDVRSEWNDLIRKQPKIPIWIFLAIFLTSSVILWYMVMSLCRKTPSRDVLSIRAQELVFHPYDYDAYEKEKIQPDDQPYEVTESLPIKLSNI